MSDIIVKPEIVEAREKQRRNDLQRERRRLAHELMCASLTGRVEYANPTKAQADVWVAGCLHAADTLIAATPIEE